MTSDARSGREAPFAYRYGGTSIAGLNRVFGYNSLYDASGNLKTGINKKSDGTIDRATSTTLGIFLAKYPTPKSYTEKEFGKLAAELLDDSDWFDINGQPIKSIYPGDAANIFQEHRKNFAQIFDANFRLSKPLPVFLFVGSSGLKKDYDPAKQSGYRFITTTAKIADNPSDSLIMGILCPTDA